MSASDQPIVRNVPIADGVWMSDDGVRFDLAIESFARLGDLVGLMDNHDGYEAIVLDAPVRARYRDGIMPGDVTMMTPGAPEKLEIDLWSTALTFEKGHRIALHISSSNSPRFEVNPNTGEAPGKHEMKPRVAVNSVFHDAAHPSALVLPIIYPAGN